MKRKWLPALVILLTLLVTSGSAWAGPGDVIFQESEVTPVAPGITYEKIWQFTPAGWLKLHVLRADLSVGDVRADLLVGSSGLAQGETLSAMAQAAGAVAAINGDFFFGRGFGTPLGPVIRAGALLSNPSARRDLSAFGLRQDGSAVLGQFTFSGSVTAADGSTFPLAGWNKPGESYREIYAYDSNWGQVTPAVAAPDAMAAVVTAGQVSAVLPAGNGVAIPADSTVLVGAGPAAAFLAAHLPPGSQVVVNMTTSPDWKDLAWAVGGGSVLIKDGQIAPFTHEVKGTSPRSAVGVGRDGRELILVAADGRQEESRGLTQSEWASLLLDLGAFQALNLDGGGSTAVLARRPGDVAAELVNSPSDGRERSLGNGIGLFSSAPQGELSGLTISAADTRVVLKGSRPLSLKGFDANYNPAPVDLEKVVWRVKPSSLGTVKDGVFYARSSGRGTITAKVGRATGELEIRVIGPAERLELSQDRIALAPGENTDIVVYARDAQGHKALVDPADLSWHVLGKVGTVKDGRLLAGNVAGTGAVEARLGSAAARALVSVGVSEQALLFFELTSGMSFAAHPAGSRGEIALATFPEPFYGHNHSLRLSYDFTSGGGTRAAYLVFAQGLALPEQAEKLSLWVYGDGQGHWLRGLVADKNGREFPVDFARTVDWTGWERAEAELPAGERPYTLKRIYLVEPDPAKRDTGQIYLDDLTVSSALPFATELETPLEPLPDPNYTKTPGSGSLRFLVTGSLPASEEGLDWAENLKAAAKKNKVNFVVSLTSLTDEARSAWEKELGVPVKAAGEISRWDVGTARFMSLNAAEGTLVQGGAEDWQWLQAQLASLKGKRHLFVFLDRQPFAAADGFSSRPEADLLRRRLSEAAERSEAGVWVLSPGNSGATAWEDGVRYQHLARTLGTEKPQFILVTVGSTKATYTKLKY